MTGHEPRGFAVPVTMAARLAVTAAVATLALVAASCVSGDPGPTGPTTTTTTTTTIPLPPNAAGVTATGDTDDGVCDAHCTLREALNLANTDPLIDTIQLPAGTFVVGSGAALRHGRVAAQAPVGLGPDGEAFRVDADLTIEGVGAGVTIIDFSGDDFTMGFLTTASLTLRTLTAGQIGVAATAPYRTLVTGDMAVSSSTVALDGVTVTDIQPDAPAPPGTGIGAGVVHAAAGTTAFDVSVTGSAVERIGAGQAFAPLGTVSITSSSFDSIGAIAITGTDSSSSVNLDHVTSINTAGIIDGTCAAGMAVATTTSSVAIFDSSLTAGTGGRCGGALPGDYGHVVAAVNDGGSTSISVDRSTIDGTGAAGAIAEFVRSSTIDSAEVAVSESTLIGGTQSAFSTSVDPPGASAHSVAYVQSSTIVSATAATGAAISAAPTAPVGLVASAALARSATLCGGGGVTSDGLNTMSDSSCAFSGVGDENGIDPRLDSAADNGGLGLTFLPQAGSPLVDTAGSYCGQTDQRGLDRPLGSACDRGAIEVEPVVTPVLKVANGGVFGCALISTGTVRCWGANSKGQLGDGTTTSRPSPVKVLGVSGAVDIAVGGAHACAVVAGGTVKCWGRNQYGELGIPTTTATQSTTAVTVAGLTGVVRVNAGGYYSCAVKSDGSEWCWGKNSRGELGDGTGVSTPVPVAVAGLTPDATLVGGAQHACAVQTDGSPFCWGRNSQGQVGDGTNDDGLSPVPVDALPSVSGLDGGDSHTCATLGDGTARCWGWNASGQLGDGTTTNRTSPVAVTGLSGVAQVVAGGEHSCARLLDATVRCWGGNDSGELGDGSTTASPTPVQVTGLSDVIDLTSSDFQTCARLLDGTVRCWGGGQLGNGSTTGSAVPVQVVNLFG